MAHQVRLVELRALLEPLAVQLQAVLGGHLLDRPLDVVEARALRVGDCRKEVGDEGLEERDVLGDELGHVHVAERAHHEEVLGLARVGALGGAGGTQH